MKELGQSQTSDLSYLDGATRTYACPIVQATSMRNTYVDTDSIGREDWLESGNEMNEGRKALVSILKDTIS